MGEKLFESDPYLKECSAKVEKIEGNKVWLDKTVFFAFSGGQQSDSGTINGIQVTGLVKESGEIIHVLEKEPDFSVGVEVKCELDWVKRFKLMKLHSSAHIVYFFFREKTGIKKLIGSNISAEKARFDFESETPVTGLLPEIESKSNEFIAEGRQISLEEDAEKKGMFWWSCGEMKMPCGGTHVKNTSEIGSVKLKRNNIGAGKERIEIYLK